MESVPSQSHPAEVHSNLTMAERRNEILKERVAEERLLREKIAVIQERQERELRLAHGRTHVQVI